MPCRIDQADCRPSSPLRRAHEKPIIERARIYVISALRNNLRIVEGRPVHNGGDRPVPRRCDSNFSGLSRIKTLLDKHALTLAAGNHSASLIAVTLRKSSAAPQNDWPAFVQTGAEFFESTYHKDLEIVDWVGSEDLFASGPFYGYRAGNDGKPAPECGAAHAAQAMTTPGDTSMGSLNEILRLMRGVGSRIEL